MQVFNASNNLLSSIQSNAFRHLQQVKILDISNNQLTRLMDNHFSDMLSIESINVSQNSINLIQPFTFTDLKTLKNLDLSNNQLYSDNFLEQIISIESINLKNNQYSHIDLSLFKKIENINLLENPWNCTWLINHLLKSQKCLSKIKFGYDFNDVTYEPQITRKVEDVVCIDANDTSAVKRHLLVINDKQNQLCDNEKNANKKVFNTFIFAVVFNYFENKYY